MTTAEQNLLYSLGNTDLPGRGQAKNIISSFETPGLGKDAQELPYRVLLVMDDSTNRLFTKKVLTRLGYSTEFAPGGLEALEVLSQASYDLVLMDCHMQPMDGLDTAKAIRAANPAVLDPLIPILAMTAGDISAEREKLLEAGMSDFITRPFLPDELDKKIKQWLSNSRSASSGENPTAQVQPRQVKEIFDEDKLLSLISGDKELEKLLITAYVSDTANRIASLHTAVDTCDKASIKINAHTIKGSSANIGAETLRRLSLRIEELNVADDFAMIAEMISLVDSEFKRFCDMVDKKGLIAPEV